MRTISVKFGEHSDPGHIVIREEHLANLLIVDVQEHILSSWPDAYFTILLRRPGESGYPAATGLVAEDSRIYYLLTGTDTAKEGQLHVEVQARNAASGLAKSWMFGIEVVPGIEVSGEVPTAPPSDWVDTVVNAKQVTDENAVKAKASEQAAGQHELQAGQHADDAREARDETRTLRNETAADAELAADAAEISDYNRTAATSAYNQLQQDIGSRVCDLIDGKIPPGRIPLLLVHDQVLIGNEDCLTQLTSGQVQKGDLAEIVEGTGTEKVIVKSFKLIEDDPGIRENWALIGTHYATNAAFASMAGTAENAQKINGISVFCMSETQYNDAYNSGILDEEALYLVTPDV